MKKKNPIKETIIDTDIITREDLQGNSYQEMLDKAYGKKGTPTRIAAEERIKERAKNLLSEIKKKETKEEKVILKIGKKLKGIKIKNGKPKKSTKSIKSAKVLVKRKPKKGIINKTRKSDKNPIGQKNSKKSGSTK